MKKIVAITMAAIMGVGLLSLVGCGKKIGNENIYDPANFKETLFFNWDTTIDEIDRKWSGRNDITSVDTASGTLVQTSFEYNKEMYFILWLRSNETIQAVHSIGGDYAVMTKRIKQFAKYDGSISRFSHDVYRHDASNSHIIVVKWPDRPYCEFIICRIGDGEKILKAEDEIHVWDKGHAYWGE